MHSATPSPQPDNYAAEPNNQFLESSGVSGVDVSTLKFFNLDPTTWAISKMLLYHQIGTKLVTTQVS